MIPADVQLNLYICTGLDKQTFSGYNSQYFLTCNFEHMFWVLIRTVSMIRFF